MSFLHYFYVFYLIKTSPFLPYLIACYSQLDLAATSAAALEPTKAGRGEEVGEGGEDGVEGVEVGLVVGLVFDWVEGLLGHHWRFEIKI